MRESHFWLLSAKFGRHLAFRPVVRYAVAMTANAASCRIVTLGSSPAAVLYYPCAVETG